MDNLARVGRPPTAIIRAQRERIIELILTGAPPHTAAIVAGVPSRTHENWLRKGRAEGAAEPYRRYAEDVDRAVEQWKLANIGHVQVAAAKDARHAEWLLERRFPEFRERRQVQSDVSVQVQPMVDWSKYTPEQAETLIELLQLGMPAADDPAISDTARPALELIQGTAERLE